jgi:hypothetical protein
MTTSDSSDQQKKLTAPRHPGLSIGMPGVELTIELTEISLEEQLRRRYAGFITNQDPSALVVNISWVDQRSALPSLNPTLAFHSRRIDISAPGYSGWIDLDQKRAKLILTSQYPIEDIDYFLRIASALLAFEAGGLLFHAAGIVHHAAGYAFFGHSGAGKTTVARFSTSDTVLNDDLVILLPDKDRTCGRSGWQIFATPFWNPNQVQPNQDRACLVGLFSLVKDSGVRLERVKMGQAVGELLSCIPVIPADPGRQPLLLERLSRLASEIPLFHLHFKKEASFWEAIDNLPLISSDA